MEIERKFLVKELPDLSGIPLIRYERYYLLISGNTEERIQKTNNRFTFERKTRVDNLTRSTEIKELTETEFEEMKAGTRKSIIRDSYSLNPSLSIKVYHGDYEGLVRAEVEFLSTDEAKNYTQEQWMGNEITNSPIGKDSSLLRLDASSVTEIIRQLSAN